MNIRGLVYVQAVTGDAGPLQPHYGSRAASRLNDAAHDWFNAQLPSIEAADGSALASFRSSLDQLSTSLQGNLQVGPPSWQITIHPNGILSRLGQFQNGF